MLSRKISSSNRSLSLLPKQLVPKKVQRAGKNLFKRVREVRGPDVPKRVNKLSRKPSRKKRFLTRSNQRSFRPP